MSNETEVDDAQEAAELAQIKELIAQGAEALNPSRHPPLKRRSQNQLPLLRTSPKLTANWLISRKTTR
jgi:hypothetical protein